MIIAANQPYFLPYISYWQLINAADVFYIGDNYAYIKRGWINRNRILFRGAPEFFGIEVDHASSFRMINELNVAKIDKRKKMNKLYEATALKKGISDLEEEKLSDGKAVMEEMRLKYGI